MCGGVAPFREPENVGWQKSMFSRSELWTGQGHCTGGTWPGTMPGELGVSLESQHSRFYLWDVVAIHIGVLRCHSWHIERDNIAFPLHFVDDSVGVVQVVPVLQGWGPCLADDRVDLGLHPGWGKISNEPREKTLGTIRGYCCKGLPRDFLSHVGTLPTGISQSCEG